ncbi:MAG: tetratricopeptide repeat protein [Oscillospiraceae bacterium]|nr:tetratricopeptide repeat protein [Oscillospiraceae bacterium]
MFKQSKKPLVILLILAVIVLAGCIWIIAADRSPETCVARGTAALNAGKYTAAVRYLSAAVDRGIDDVDVSLDLAEAYRQTGNYTKAEYSLVRAMSRHADDTRLYLALCRAYAEQGKFLDAFDLLDRIANDAVKAELDAMRPAAPHLTPDGGFFSDYITVSAYCTAGHLYVSTDGGFPVSTEQAYSEPIALGRGETTICAIVVDDQGLVSQPTIAKYTISGIMEEVTVSDAALDAILREALGKNAEDTLMSGDLWTIEELWLTSDVKDTTALQYCVGLKKLTIDGGASSDLSFLPLLSHLESLTLTGRTLSSGDLNQIAAVTSLQSLNIANCAARDIGALKSLTDLKELNLSDNIVENLDAIASMQQIEVLNLHNNPVTSISALRGCMNLCVLDVSSCKLTNLNALADRPALEELNADANRLTTLEALRGCTGLKSLNVAENALTDVSILAELVALETVDLSHNELELLPKFNLEKSALCNIDLSHNKVSSLEPLRDLVYLNYIFADDNEIRDLSPVAGCYNLVEISVWDNPIDKSTIQSLTEHSIRVRYNPN